MRKKWVEWRQKWIAENAGRGEVESGSGEFAWSVEGGDSDRDNKRGNNKKRQRCCATRTGRTAKTPANAPTEPKMNASAPAIHKSTRATVFLTLWYALAEVQRRWEISDLLFVTKTRNGMRRDRAASAQREARTYAQKAREKVKKMTGHTEGN